VFDYILRNENVWRSGRIVPRVLDLGTWWLLSYAPQPLCSWTENTLGSMEAEWTQLRIEPSLLGFRACSFVTVLTELSRLLSIECLCVIRHFINIHKILDFLKALLTFNLLTTTIVALPSNASKWQMGFNSAFRGLTCVDECGKCLQICRGQQDV
jgi:hypothetical protein